MKKVTIFLLFTCTFMGYIFSQRHYIDSLEYFLKTAKDDTNKVKILNRIINTSIRIPPLNREAIKNDSMALCISEKLKNKQNIAFYLTALGHIECYEKLSEIAAKSGDYKKAFEFYRNFSTLKDSMFSESDRKEIIEMDIKYETEKKDAEIVSEQRLIKSEKRKKDLAISLGGGIILSGGFVAFVLFRRRRTKHAFQTKQLENKVLRSQLNPHFIFNALNSIQNFIQVHPETAESYLAGFSHLMREVLENSEQETITLERELSMLKKYMDLETLRVSNGFDCEINIEGPVEEQIIKVPPLILQPIVENAIWHGIAGRSEKGKILIKIGIKGKMLQCIIESYCAGESSGKKDEGIKGKSLGLQIIRDRLSNLSARNRPNGYINMLKTNNGMQVQIGIPI